MENLISTFDSLAEQHSLSVAERLSFLDYARRHGLGVRSPYHDLEGMLRRWRDALVETACR